LAERLDGLTASNCQFARMLAVNHQTANDDLGAKIRHAGF
jgi:hypothetical protein